MRSGRRALTLAQESKSVWGQVSSTTYLAYGLLEAGAYEEVLVLMQHAVTQARSLPPMLSFQRFLTVLGRTYHTLQQWEEARSMLEEAEAITETSRLGPYGVPVLSQLCMHYAEAGEWQAAYSDAMKASVLRKSTDVALIVWDLSPHYETEALLRGGNGRQAREEVDRLGERLGPNRHFRIPYLG